MGIVAAGNAAGQGDPRPLHSMPHRSWFHRSPSFIHAAISPASCSFSARARAWACRPWVAAAEVCSSADPRNVRTRTGVALGLPGARCSSTPPRSAAAAVASGSAASMPCSTHTTTSIMSMASTTSARSASPLAGRCRSTAKSGWNRIRRAFDYAFERCPRRGRPPEGDIRADHDQPLRSPRLPCRALAAPARRASTSSASGSAPSPTAPTRTRFRPRPGPCSPASTRSSSTACGPRRHPTHFSLDEALAVAARVAARRTLFVRMSHDIDHAAVSARLPAGVELAYDGLTIPLVA